MHGAATSFSLWRSRTGATSSRRSPLKRLSCGMSRVSDSPGDVPPHAKASRRRTFCAAFTLRRSTQSLTMVLKAVGVVIVHGAVSMFAGKLNSESRELSQQKQARARFAQVRKPKAAQNSSKSARISQRAPRFPCASKPLRAARSGSRADPSSRTLGCEPLARTLKPHAISRKMLPNVQRPLHPQRHKCDFRTTQIKNLLVVNGQDQSKQ